MPNKRGGFPDIRLNPLGYRSSGIVPFISSVSALHYSVFLSGTDVLRDRTGVSDRDSIMSKYFDGDGTTAIRFADFVSTSLTYFDKTLNSEQITSTDINGDFVIPANGVFYIDIAGNRWIAEEIIDPTDTSQYKFADTTGTYIAEAINTPHATWVQNSVHAPLILSDNYGYTYADGSTMYKDQTHTLLYDINQPIPALYLGGGIYSTLYCKAYDLNGDLILLTYKKRIKHQFYITDIAGTPTIGGGYIKLKQNYPLIQSSDLTDTMIDDHTLDEPTNSIIEMATIANVIGNQIFVVKDGGQIKRLLIYDNKITDLEDLAIVARFMQLNEPLRDSNGEVVTDSNDKIIYAYQDWVVIA